MADARGFRAVLVSMGLLIGGAWVATELLGEGPLRGYLPGDNAAMGWTKDGEPQEFEGDDLYTYIDGGAEIYQEYGFRRVIIQDYKNAGGKSVSLEIFEMETPAAAFGMFTFKRSGDGKMPALGAGGELEAYYMNFWKGRFLMTLTGFDESPETIGGLMAVGGVVDSKIGGAGDLPRLVAALPEKGLKPGSVKFLKGMLGLNNTYPFYTARGLSFKEAARGVYENGATLLILDYGSAEARGKAWTDLQAYLSGSEKFRVVAAGHSDVYRVLDTKGQSLTIMGSGPCLLVGISPDPAASLEIVGRTR